jgi:hypothetical protein
VYELTTSLGRVPPKPWSDQNLNNGVEQIEDYLLSLVLYAAVLFAATSMMIYATKGASSLSKIIFSCSKMIMMMLPTTVLTCVTLVACFAGHADAFYVDKGLCYNRATGKK